MVLETIIQKIQKLFALAGNNPNEHERMVALDAANKLMDEHNLSLASIEGYNPEHNVTAEPATFGRRQDMEFFGTLRVGIAKLNSCDIMWTPHHTKIIIGSAANIEATKSMIIWLVDTIWQEAELGYRSFHEKRAFAIGASAAISARCHAMVEARDKPEQQQSKGTGTSLMVLRNKLAKANSDFAFNTYGRRPTYGRSRRSSRFGSAMESGREYGQSVNLNKQVGRTSKGNITG